MRGYTDTGFVIKQKQFKEADKLIVILTKNHGRVETVAKSVGKPLSKKSGSLELLNYIRASFYETKGLDIILEVELIDEYADVKKSLAQISEVFYILEIIDRFSVQAAADKDLYDLLHEYFALYRKYPQKIGLLLAVFELKLLHVTGFAPLLDTYLISGNGILPDQNRVAASGGDVGYIEQDKYGPKNFTPELVSDRILKIQKYILENDIIEAVKLEVKAEDLSRLKSIHKTWLEGVLENRLKSVNFLEKIRSL